jgi:transcriptional regulator with XRE-family HTH domain/predicted transcriptional regulator
MLKGKEITNIMNSYKMERIKDLMNNKGLTASQISQITGININTTRSYITQIRKEQNQLTKKSYIDNKNLVGKLYYEDKLSIEEISKQTELAVQTVKGYLVDYRHDNDIHKESSADVAYKLLKQNRTFEEIMEITGWKNYATRSNIFRARQKYPDCPNLRSTHRTTEINISFVGCMREVGKLKNKDIANKLNLSASTVNTYYSKYCKNKEKYDEIWKNTNHNIIKPYQDKYNEEQERKRLEELEKKKKEASKKKRRKIRRIPQDLNLEYLDYNHVMYNNQVYKILNKREFCEEMAKRNRQLRRKSL